jgi:HEPN domain-containing protein
MAQEADGLSRDPRRWFQSADENLQVVRVAIVQRSKNLAAFQLEQAVDKYLQGLLIPGGSIPAPDPDISELANAAQAKDPRFGKFRSFCRKLAPYLEARYPPLLKNKPTFEELRADVETARELGALARELVGVSA